MKEFASYSKTKNFKIVSLALCIFGTFKTCKDKNSLKSRAHILKKGGSKSVDELLTIFLLPYVFRSNQAIFLFVRCYTLKRDVISLILYGLILLHSFPVASFEFWIFIDQLYLLGFIYQKPTWWSVNKYTFDKSSWTQYRLLV